MDIYREHFLIVGLLYLLNFIAGFLSISRSIDSSDYLSESAENPFEVKKAAFFQNIMTIFYALIIYFLYPILKNYNIGIAIGFIFFRIIAIIFVLYGTKLLFTILQLSQNYLNKKNFDKTHYVELGAKLKHRRDTINHVGMIISQCLGSIFLFLGLYQIEVIHLWILLFGLLGTLLSIIASILIYLKRLDVISKSYLTLNSPLMLQELIFALWLISYGF